MVDNLDEMKLENDIKMEKVKEEVFKKLQEYKKTIAFMSADAPISILCLPSVIEKALINHGLLRVYDLFEFDFTEVEGLSSARIQRLTSSLDQFFSML